MDVHGTIDQRFGPARDVFADVVRAQSGTGAAVAAWVDGAWVIDLWAGPGDAGRTRHWDRDSIVMPYSVTKPFAAMCALLLVDRGALDLDTPMQTYWPQFRARATVRHVLSHQAGVVALDEPVPTEAFFDWDRMCALLAAQEPEWEPGTAHGESALFFGHLVGELVRRVDGRSLGGFLRDEVCGPLGLDFAVGLDIASHRRVVDLTGLNDAFRRENENGRPELYRRAIANPPGGQDGEVVNSPAWRAAEIPALNGHGTARAIAGPYAALLRGDLLSPALLREATTAQCTGTDRVFGFDNAWGLGFGVHADGFGMGGLGGSVGWASRVGGYAYGFVTGSAGDHDRSDAVENALRSCLGSAAPRGLTPFIGSPIIGLGNPRRYCGRTPLMVGGRNVKEPEAPMNQVMKALRGRSAVMAVVVLALVMTSCASKKPAASGGGGGAGDSIATASVSGVGTVLVNAQGRTLYYLMTDNHSQPTCTGSCASTWPPMIVSGSVPAAGSGVTGALGTVANPDGRKQLTYMGWPLYTYSGDSAAGQANGQGSGGVWFAMAASGPSGSGGGSSPSSGGKYGGY